MQRESVEFICAQLHHTIKVDESKDFLIDIGSTISLVKDPELVDKIQKCKNQRIMRTNDGKKRFVEEGDMKEFGEVYFDKEAMTNLVSLSNILSKGHRVYINTDLENFFMSTDKSKKRTSKFLCNEEGIYVRESDLPSSYWVSNYAGNTITCFTQREIKRAKRDRKLYHDLNAHSYPDLKI